MAIFSKELCQARLQLWLDAEAAVATGQAYQIGTRSLTRADLEDIRDEIEFWADKLAEVTAEESSNGRNRLYHFTLRDL